jgi:two-component system chemotaxis sensor kinase CheA
MDKHKLLATLQATFAVELEEQLASLRAGLLALASDPRSVEQVAAALRAAHTIKGAARAVSANEVEERCHAIEDELGAVRDGSVEVDRALLAQLSAAIDLVEVAGTRLRLGDTSASIPLAAEALFTGDSSGMQASRLRISTVAGGSLRVSLSKLDALLARSEETSGAAARLDHRRDALEKIQAVVVEWRRTPADDAATRLAWLERELAAFTVELGRDLKALRRASDVLDLDVRSLRMSPFSDAAFGLDRGVDDAASASGTVAELVLEGAEVELDAAIVEALRAPLMHLARNAVDHGLESAEERLRVGKPAVGKVIVRAVHLGAEVEITVADDGRGVALQRVAERAREQGIAVPTGATGPLALLFRAGFSTSPTVTGVSGRGVGLDVVRSTAERLHGSVDVRSEAGRGTRFVLRLPVLLSSVKGLLVEAGGEPLVLPASNVRRVVRIAPADVRTVQGRGTLDVDGEPVGVRSLASALGLPPSAPLAHDAHALAVVVRAGDRQIAFVVDRVVSEVDAIVKALGNRIRRSRCVFGVSLLPTGKLALLLQVAWVIRAADALAVGLSVAVIPQRGARRRVLVVDDSLTTRTLERSILEAAGFEVAVAVDGADAWRLLQERGAELVVSDVEMPRMDGFGLCEAIRASVRFRDLPLVLVTALGSDRDRARGVEAGADAYLVKSAFDQTQLLTVIEQLLGGAT